MVRPWKSTSHNKITRVSPPQAGMIMRLAKYDLVWSAAALLLFGASSVPAQTPFYGYYDGTNTIFGPPYNYTNIYRVEKGTPTSEIADILANGQRLALFDVWINPTPADLVHASTAYLSWPTNMSATAGPGCSNLST